METHNSDDIKEFRTSQSSLKSNKSVDKSSTSGSIKYEKGSIHFKDFNKEKNEDNHQHHHQSTKILYDASTKVPHKFIANWKSACDKTKDKTKDLLKRWRTLPEIETNNDNTTTLIANNKKEETTNENNCGWSVHVWTTWVDRFSIESDSDSNKDDCTLTPVQNNKFSHFFTSLLDHDQDNLICEQDFEVLIERLRHFADWSVNSTEFNILREVERGFIETFLNEDASDDDKLGFTVNGQVYITKQGWLRKWSQLVYRAKNLSDFPIWLQFFSKVLFQVINRTGDGIIKKEELSAFYSSVLGLDNTKVAEILDNAFMAMTSNGDHNLMYKAYRLCFANYLLGRYPNGPGQYILGAPPCPTLTSAMFPVDYSALNTPPEDLEQYIPDHKSNRHSIIV